MGSSFHLVFEKSYATGNVLGMRRKGSFWWRDILKLVDQFKGLATVDLKDGRTCHLWHDLWQNFFSFAKETAITVHAARNTTILTHLFFTPLSDQALAQLDVLLHLLDDLLHHEGTLLFPHPTHISPSGGFETPRVTNCSRKTAKAHSTR